MAPAHPDDQGNRGLCTHHLVSKALANGFFRGKYSNGSIDFNQREIAVCVLFQFNYADHDNFNKITINIEAATRLFACARGFRNISY